jgi:hypothetical protein
MRLSPALVALSVILPLSIATALPAHAEDCPPGSIHRSQDGYGFCEPTVCLNDGQCNPNEVCRPVPLCMQVGKLTSDAATLGDASARLVVTQRCAPDKSCPQTTVCSDLSRCVSKAAAEKMGLLTTTAASASAAPASAAGEKKSCGCRAVGARTESTTAASALLGVALAAVALGRRRSRTR